MKGIGSLTLPPQLRSSRLRIGAAFSLLALVLFSAVGLLSGEQARRQAQRDAGAVLKQLAERLAVGLQVGLSERFREIQNLAKLVNLIDDRIEPAQWRSMVERIQSSFVYYSWIGVARPDGRVVAATGGLLEGRNVSQRPWFIEGLVHSHVGDVHDALLLASLLGQRPDGEPLRLIDFSAPLMNDGRVEGVIGAHLTLDWVRARREETLRTTDPAHRVEISIAGADSRTIMGPAVPSADVLASLVHGPAIVEWSDRKHYLTSVVHSAEGAGNRIFDWTIVARQPVETALAPADELRRRIWLLGAAATFLFGTVGWWLAGRLTAPLRAVARQAEAMVGGSGWSVRSHNEVEQLAQSLKALLVQLRERQQELVSLNASLETRVQQRTARLNQVNEDLRSFSRSVSHDVKGPIGSIGMVVRTVLTKEGDRLDLGSRRLLAEVARECDRLRQLTDELLALALVEQSEMSLAPVAMGDLVREVAAGLRSAPDASDAIASTELIVGELPVIHGDAVLLRQVWQNLLANAFKFTAKVEAPRVEVQVREADDGFEFSVIDNGAGFDMGQAERLFRTFQRLHRNADYPGTGIGLSIVKRVVHRHGGRVWAHGRPGQGASFSFYIPRASEVEPPEFEASRL